MRYTPATLWYSQSRAKTFATSGNGRRNGSRPTVIDRSARRFTCPGRGTHQHAQQRQSSTLTLAIRSVTTRRCRCCTVYGVRHYQKQTTAAGTKLTRPHENQRTQRNHWTGISSNRSSSKPESRERAKTGTKTRKGPVFKQHPITR